MNKIYKVLIIWLCMGMVYYTIEGIWRISNHGYASVWMLLVGGLCGVAVGSLNQFPKFFKLKVVWQSLIGVITTLLIEFCAGCIFNLLLGWNIWDYSSQFGNILGQVCLPYGIIWFLIMPFAIWLEDSLRYLFWEEGNYYTIGTIYKEFILCE